MAANRLQYLYEMYARQSQQLSTSRKKAAMAASIRQTNTNSTPPLGTSINAKCHRKTSFLLPVFDYKLSALIETAGLYNQ